MTRPRPPRRRLLFQTLDERRVLASIAGSVFDDVNDSLRREAAEIGVAGRLMFLDANANDALDVGEAYAVTDSRGQFGFDDLAAGDYRVALFGGAASQIQTTPTAGQISATAATGGAMVAVVSAAGTEAAVLAEAQTLTLLGDRAGSADLDGELVALSRLNDASLLAVSRGPGGSEVVTLGANLTNPADVDGSAATLAGIDVVEAAIDRDGRGLLLGQEIGEFSATLRALRVDVPGRGVTPLTIDFPVGTQILADRSAVQSGAATRTIVAQPDVLSAGSADESPAAGLLQIYNNATAELIGTPAAVDPSTLLAFSDPAGVLIVRSGPDLIGYDVDGGFAELFRVDEATLGTDLLVAIDPVRDALVAVDATAGVLRLLGLETGQPLGSFDFDASAIGTPTAIDLDPELAAIVIGGTTGAVELSLRRPVSPTITIDDADAVGTLEFGIRVVASNDAPQYQTLPELGATEDQPLSLPATATRAGSFDIQADRYVILPGPAVLPDGSQATRAGGTAIVGVDGSLQYNPPADFNGEDAVEVRLHDGHLFRTIALPITVAPTPDRPTQIRVSINPVSELVAVGTVIGEVQVFDVDGDEDLQISTDDQRFEVVDGQMIFVGPDPLNFEDEPTIPLSVTADDAAFGDEPLTVQTTVSVVDADDPITDLILRNLELRENRPGERVSDILVEDQDPDQFYAFSVSDERFEIFFGELQLRRGVAVDFEAEPTITLDITASFADDVFTKSVTLRVIDAAEVPGEIFLAGPREVLEREPAAVVGEITVGGNPGQNGHVLSVDDGRFVIDQGVLRLADGVSVRRLDQELIQLRVTATAIAGGASTSAIFDIEVLVNDLPFHNETLPEDVNGSGDVTPLDALLIINFLNDFGPSEVGPGNPNYDYDVNGDGRVTALDALLIINFINRQERMPSTGGEGQPEPPPGDPLQQLDRRSPAGPRQFALPDPGPLQLAFSIVSELPDPHGLIAGYLTRSGAGSLVSMSQSDWAELLDIDRVMADGVDDVQVDLDKTLELLG